MFKLVVCVSVLAMLAVATAQPSVSASENGGWWGDLYEQKIIPLENILKRPRSFLGQTVSIIGQFHKLGEIDNPFYTKFEAEWYLNFSIWSEETPLWEKASYLSDFQYLFVRRESEGAKAILNAPMYSRFVIVAQVSDVFKGKPWLEVTGLKRLGPQMNEASLVHIVKGHTLLRIHRYEASAKEFAAADSKSLPRYVRAMLLREQAISLHELGKSDEAMSRLQAAYNLNPEDKVTKARIQALRQSVAQKNKKGKKNKGEGKKEATPEKKKPAAEKGAELSSKASKGK